MEQLGQNQWKYSDAASAVTLSLRHATSSNFPLPADILPHPMESPLQSGSVISGERICGGSLITFCSAALATKSEFSSSAITIDFHLLDPDVDRSMAEYEECRLEWT